MAFDNTITEFDVEANSRLFAANGGTDGSDLEPDLSVDGLSDSLLSRVLGIFGLGK